LQRLRQMRRERLDQYDMGGVMEDIRRQLEEILELERDTLRDRMGDDQRGAGAQQPEGSDGPDSHDGREAGEPGEQGARGEDGQQSPQSPQSPQSGMPQSQRGQQP